MIISLEINELELAYLKRLNRAVTNVVNDNIDTQELKSLQPYLGRLVGKIKDKANEEYVSQSKATQRIRSS